MKGHATLMSRVSDEWSTPQDLIQNLDAIYGFDLDAAATAENAIVARWLGPGSSLATDALTVRWADYGRVIWCNPPYSRLREFLAKGAEAMRDGAFVMFLIPARTDTRAWHEHVWDLERRTWRRGVWGNLSARAAEVRRGGQRRPIPERPSGVRRTWRPRHAEVPRLTWP